MSVRLLFLLLAFGGLTAAGDDAFEPPDAAEINEAIDAGVEWLRAAQREDGSWGPCTSGAHYGGGLGGRCYEVGPTAFSVYVLAVCGVPRSDQGIRRAVQWLREYEETGHPYTSYERSAIVLMLTELYAPRRGLEGGLRRTKNPRTRPGWSSMTRDDWRWMHRCLGEILDNVGGDGGAGYWVRLPGYADVSATQFAALALRAASLAGYPVEHKDHRLWHNIAEYHRELQEEQGGFPYHKRHEWSSGMTAAGASSLLICREQMRLLEQEVPAWLDPCIERAFARLDDSFDPARNHSPEAGRGRYHYCHLYAVERAGVLGERRELGKKDWYLRGARYLVDEQHENGKWVDRTCMDPEDVLGTCFALLFLKKATMPAVTLAR